MNIASKIAHEELSAPFKKLSQNKTIGAAVLMLQFHIYIVFLSPFQCMILSFHYFSEFALFIEKKNDRK